MLLYKSQKTKEVWIAETVSNSNKDYFITLSQVISIFELK